MTDIIQKETRLLPEQWRKLSGSWLKVIAIVTMTIDHAASFLCKTLPAFKATLFVIGSKHISWLFLMHCVGRLAFPLFAFLLVEGFLHTRNRRKYGRNLLIFALLSVIPWNLAHSGTFFYRSQNVLFTLFLGFLALCAVSDWETKKISATRMAVIVFGLIAAGIVFHVDYTTTGVGFILLLYVLRQNRILQAAIGWCYLPMRWISGFGFILINMYNGRRGFIQGPIAKYLFYVYYPCHLLLLYLLSRNI
jgi:hypothetical protein